MNLSRCPNCGCGSVKVIAAGVPLKICEMSECGSFWGFWSNVYAGIVVPLLWMFHKDIKFMTYEGSYFKALKRWTEI